MMTDGSSRIPNELPEHGLIGGRYRLGEMLGAGGMGIVYRALDLLAPPGRQAVALKRLTADDANLRFASLSTSRLDERHESLRVALALEFQTLASLRHPNIIRVLDYGFDHAPDTASPKAPPYLVMDLLENARTLIEAGADAPFADKIDLLVQMLGALVYLHRRGILHRDLKPENVMVVAPSPDSPPVVKVLDFGLAISREALRTIENYAVGTLSYMAPEVIAGDAPGEASDLYAVGVIAYELLTGAHPFPSRSPGEFVREVMRGEFDISRLYPFDDTEALSSSISIVFDTDADSHRDTEPATTATQTAGESETRFAVEETLGQNHADSEDVTADVSDPRLEGVSIPSPIEVPLSAPTLSDVIVKLLSRHPRNRYHDAAQVIRDLCAAAHIEPPAESDAVRDSYLQAAQFVGRENELNALIDALGAASENRVGSVWLIGGESGVGKSRLVDELRIRALVRGVAVLRGQAENTGVPYQMWREPLRRLIVSGSLSAAAVAALTPLIPDVETLSGTNALDQAEADAADSAQTPRDRVLNALLDGFERIAANPHPAAASALVLLEDLQWAGESLDVLKGLAPAAAELPLMIVGTYRNDEVPTLPDSFPYAQRIELARLTPMQIARLSAAMLGENATTPALRDLLERETEGNAFFLVEVMRALAEEAGGLNEIARRLSLPERVLAGGVQQVVRRRLNRVAPDARQMLRLAAIMGRIIDAPALEYAAATFGIDLGFEDIEAWLTGCANVAVLEYVEGSWRFSHDKLRETILDDLGRDAPDEFARFHRQAAEALEAVHPTRLKELASVLAGHWRAAGDPARERLYLVDAAVAAFEAQDYRAAKTHYARALELHADELDPNPSQARARFHLEWARSAFHISEYEEVLQHSEIALELFRAVGDTFNEAEALTLIGEVNMRRGVVDRAETLFQEAFELRRPLGKPLYIGYSLMNLGALAYLRGELAPARDLWLEAQALIDVHGKMREKATALANVALITDMLGEWDTARRYYQRAIGIQRTLKDREGLSHTLMNLAFMALDEKNLEAARTYSEEAMYFARQIGNRVTLGYAFDVLGQIASAAGEHIEAARHYAESASIRRSLGQASMLIQSLERLASALIDLNDLGGARTALIEGLSLRRSITHIKLNPHLQTAARLTFLEGCPAQAYQIMRAVQRETVNVGSMFKVDITLLERIETELRAALTPDEMAVLETDETDMETWADRLLTEWKGETWQGSFTTTSKPVP